jgi:hypothetical protein
MESPPPYNVVRKLGFHVGARPQKANKFKCSEANGDYRQEQCHQDHKRGSGLSYYSELVKTDFLRCQTELAIEGVVEASRSPIQYREGRGQ